MRDFLINNCPAIMITVTVLEAAVTAIMFVRFSKDRKVMTFIMGLIGVGLLFDAAAMVLGAHIPADVLPVISRMRFVSHGLLIPLNLAVCAYSLGWDDLKLKIVWGITGVLCILGAASGFARVLELREFAGIVRHVAGDSTPVWADKINSLLSFGTVLPVIASGVYVLIKQKAPSILLAGVLMFAFSALGPATGNTDLIFLISMFGELLMIFFYWVYARKSSNVKEEDFFY